MLLIKPEYRDSRFTISNLAQAALWGKFKKALRGSTVSFRLFTAIIFLLTPRVRKELAYPRLLIHDIFFSMTYLQAVPPDQTVTVSNLKDVS